MEVSFDKAVQERQINWRKKYISTTEMGVQNGVKRPWILPKDNWKDGLFKDVRDNLLDYLKKAQVQPHKGVHNLKSSWILCANLYFPFSRDKQMLAGFLNKNISMEIESVDRIDLEYEDKDELLKPSKLLGEPEGTRGANQTSPDIAFLVNGGKGLILIENKYTEHSFYPCSGRKSQYHNPDIKKCLDISNVLKNPQENCYMSHWQKDSKRGNRKYWKFINISDYGMKILTRCPAATSGYQLFRQQALAEGIAQYGRYQFVISCVAYDENNETLIRCMKLSGIDDFRTGWKKLFNGKARFASFSHQQWVNWVRENDKDNKWQNWLEYVNQRYGY
jgi:hypothetical protein